jgi:hypothetical protein
MRSEKTCLPAALQLAANSPLWRQAERSAALARKLDDSSPAMMAVRAAEPYARELERLAALKPTKWEAPDLTA